MVPGSPSSIRSDELGSRVGRGRYGEATETGANLVITQVGVQLLRELNRDVLSDLPLEFITGSKASHRLGHLHAHHERVVRHSGWRVQIG